MQQGPIGQFLNKLGMVGVPPEMIQYFQVISQQDEKEIQKAVEEGDIPQFQQMLMAMVQGQPEQQTDPEQLKLEMEMQIEQAKVQMEQAKTQAEVEKDQATIVKTQADTALVQEKILTERVTQQSIMAEIQIKAKGVEFDVESMQHRRAKVVTELQAAQNAEQRADLKLAEEMKTSSNKRRVERATATAKIIDGNKVADATAEAKVAPRASKIKTNETSGEFIDRGIRSDNEEV